VLQSRPGALRTLIKLSPLFAPIRALAVALAGVALAALWFDGQWQVALLIAALACLVGLAFDWLAKAVLPSRPVIAVYLMEWWILTPAMIAAVAAAAVIVVTVLLTVPDSESTETKKLIGALATGVTSFLSAAFVSWFGDAKDSTLADHIRDAFRAKYKRRELGTPSKPGVKYFEPGSPGERWVYSVEFRGVEGWGQSDRVIRARGIATELTSGNSDPTAVAPPEQV
jgi:hypothetical protein